MPPPTTAVTTTTNRHDRRALAWAGESEHGPEAGQLPPAPGAVRRPPPRPLPPRPRPQRTQAGNQSACGCSRVRVAGQTVRAWGPIAAAAADGAIANRRLPPPPPPGSRPGRRGAGLVDCLRPPAQRAAASSPAAGSRCGRADSDSWTDGVRREPSRIAAAADTGTGRSSETRGSEPHA